MSFGEKKTEFSPKHGKELPVWQSPKYLESRKKAEDIINSGKYGVQESDFWILMNATKNEKMAYTGLIISHNGCLKINDSMDTRFDPACVTLDKDGYRGSLVYSYCSPSQGIYEVGEVSASNCKNEYPYAMAFKRLFDRVVLKLSKLAYAGIYSDSEADEFAQRLDGADQDKNLEKKASDEKYDEGKKADARAEEPPTVAEGNTGHVCEKCGNAIKDAKNRAGEVWKAKDIATYTKLRFGRPLCVDCAKKVEKS